MFKVNDRVRLTSEGLSHVKVALPEIFKLLVQDGQVEGHVAQCAEDGTITLILPGAQPNTCVTIDLAATEPGRFLELLPEPPLDLADPAADGAESYGEQMAAQQCHAVPMQSHGPAMPPRQTPVPLRVQFAHQVFQHFIGLKQYAIAHSMERAVRGQQPVAPGDEWKAAAAADPHEVLQAAGPLTEAERDLYEEAMFKMRQWISQKD